MAQLVVTPTGSGSGGVYYNPGTWATVHDAATGTGAGPNDTQTYIQGIELGGTHYITRVFLIFDTSTIPDDATIDSVTLAVKQAGAITGVGPVAAVVGNTQASPTDLVVADYDQLGTTLFSDTVAINGSDGSDFTFTFTTAGKNAISKTGYTQIGIRDYTYDILNVDPSSRNDAQIYVMTAAKYPTLTVNYTPATGASWEWLMMGVGR